MESMMYGLTSNDLRRLAFQLAERNGIAHQFNREKQMAGKDWMYSFIKRHPISLRQPEATSAARARSFNRTNVNKFFDLLEPLMDKHKFPPNNIYNVDETGISTVQSKPSKVLAKTGRKQVGSLVSAERGQTVTVETCMSVTGSFIPPMFVFPRVRMKMELMDEAPPGSIHECHKSGWMQMDIFTKWFKHFIRSSGTSKDNPVLLILDGHATHVRNLDVIDLARDNGVVMLCLPPHCSHRMQPLDVSFMKPLSTYYDQELEKWLRNNPGRVVTSFQVAELFGNAYMRAATTQVAASGFRKTGIYPTNRDVFLPHEFLVADVTDLPMDDRDNKEHSESRVEVAAPGCEDKVDGEEGIPELTDTVDSEEPDKETHGAATEGSKTTPNLLAIPPTPDTDNGNAGPSTSRYQSPFVISPPPKASTTSRTKRSNARRGKAVVLTESPYKSELILSKTTRAKKGNPGKARTCNKRSSVVQPQTGGKRKRKTEQPEAENDTSSTEDDDAECIYCSELWSAGKDGMIKCSLCFGWAHEACAGKEGDSDEEFVCDLCS
ncbi:uncharacterized protein LOC121410818 isoform X2 [Lytechinus variegatus]|uniref:uncharacterized protein LOC121410818 isoform X1 n=1 Tax=Lytechinus variegatus TaxID=7654 RepID=UPI001BB2ABA9|nr:uncharacterized protein LOC121410818 isoform X1 [Lytechinus variegatus]XP_041459065.1 uncharacterized protein LOC121410818 isoform X2 [Lytechinus variegatus]